MPANAMANASLFLTITDALAATVLQLAIAAQDSAACRFDFAGVWLDAVPGAASKNLALKHSCAKIVFLPAASVAQLVEQLTLNRKKQFLLFLAIGCNH